MGELQHYMPSLATGVMVKSVWQEVAAAELQNSVQDGHDRDLLHCPFAKH